MQLITKRQHAILKMLLSQSEFTSTKVLAKKFEVSERTIRYDLDSISAVLDNVSTKLLRIPKHGIKIAFADDAARYKLLNRLDQSVINVFSPEDRIINLCLLLFIANATISDLSEQLQVSKNTIIQDLKKAKIYLKKSYLILKSVPYHGTHIAGPEKDLRYSFIEFYCKSDNFKHIILEKISKNNDSVTAVIKSIENTLKVKYSKQAFEELSLILLYSLWRISQGYHVEYPTEYLQAIQKKPIFIMLKESLLYIESSITDSEIYYFTHYFKSAKLASLSKTYAFENTTNTIGLQVVADFENYIGIKFAYDTNLIGSILTHFNIAVYRLKNNFKINNSLVAEIRYEIGLIYAITEKILRKYEFTLNVIFPETEIAYLAMHFAAIFENLSNRIFAPSVAVVCDNELSISRLLAVRINNKISNVRIITICSTDDLPSILKQYNIDLIITTVAIEIDDPIVVQTSPLLNKKDLAILREFIINKIYQKSSQYLAVRYAQGQTFAITDIVASENAMFDFDITDWKKAIYAAAKPLVKTNKVDYRYVEDIISNIENLGTYMVFIPEIAFVHAKADYVNCDSVSLITLKKRIQFGDVGNVPVKVIIVLANRTKNMNLINLVNILSHGDNITKITNATQYEDLTTIS